MEFKGTKGEWVIDDNYKGMVLTESGAYMPNSMMLSMSTDIELKANAKLIADAGNVRKQINCSLPELLEQRNELLEALQYEVSLLQDIRSRDGWNNKEANRHSRMIKAINKALN